MTTYEIELDDRVLAEVQRLMGRTDVDEVVGIALSHMVSIVQGRSPITGEDVRGFAEAAKDLGDPRVRRLAWE